MGGAGGGQPPGRRRRAAGPGSLRRGAGYTGRRAYAAFTNPRFHNCARALLSARSRNSCQLSPHTSLLTFSLVSHHRGQGCAVPVTPLYALTRLADTRQAPRHVGCRREAIVMCVFSLTLSLFDTHPSTAIHSVSDCLIHVLAKLHTLGQVRLGWPLAAKQRQTDRQRRRPPSSLALLDVLIPSLVACCSQHAQTG